MTRNRNRNREANAATVETPIIESATTESAATAETETVEPAATESRKAARFDSVSDAMAAAIARFGEDATLRIPVGTIVPVGKLLRVFRSSKGWMDSDGKVQLQDGKVQRTVTLPTDPESHKGIGALFLLAAFELAGKEYSPRPVLAYVAGKAGRKNAIEYSAENADALAAMLEG